jgi:hypothetical protein
MISRGYQHHLSSLYSDYFYIYPTGHWTRRCRCGGRSFLVKKLSSCTLHQVLNKIQIFSNVMDFTHRKSCDVQNQVWFAVVWQMRFLNEPLLRKNKQNGEKKILVNRLAQRNKHTYPVTTLRFIINASTENCQKGRLRINFFLPLCMKNTARQEIL